MKGHLCTRPGQSAGHPGCTAAKQRKDVRGELGGHPAFLVLRGKAPGGPTSPGKCPRMYFSKKEHDNGERSEKQGKRVNE